MVSLSVYLFGKPAWEVDEDRVNRQVLRELGVDLKNRLDEVADITDKLLTNDWKSEMGLYDVYFNNNDLNLTQDDLEEYLKGIGVDPEEVSMDDLEDEDDFDDEDGDDDNFTSTES